MRQKINSCFHILYGCLFFIIISLLLFVQEAVRFNCKKQFLLNNKVILLLSLVALFLFFALYSALKQLHILSKLQKCKLKLSYNKIVWVLTVFLFLLQIYISYNIYFNSNWDVYYINTAAFRWATGHSEKLAGLYNYSRYPNNLFITLCQAAIIKFNNALGIFQGFYLNMSIVCVNCLFSSATCLLVYKILCLYQSKKYAFAGFILCILLYGFSPWMAICYSDSFGIIFPVLCFYLYARPQKNKWLKLLSCVLAASIACVGYLIKPHCIIILIAALGVEFLFNLGKKNYKQFIAVFCIAVWTVGFYSLINAQLNNYYEKSAIHINKEETYSWPHFLMMGLNPQKGGIYCYEDVQYSQTFKTAEERKAGNLAEAKKRIKAMGPVGYAKHLSKKTLIAYHDGTFAWGEEGRFYYQIPKLLNSRMARFLRSCYYVGGIRYNYFLLYSQFIWLTVLFLNFAAVFQKRNAQPNPKLCVLFLSIIGLTAFQLLFEVRARYLYTYLPIYCIIAIFGLKNFNCLCGKAVNAAKKLFKKRALQK